MCRALGSSRTREKEPCDRVLSLPCGFHKRKEAPVNKKEPRALAVHALLLVLRDLLSRLLAYLQKPNREPLRPYLSVPLTDHIGAAS